SRMRSRRQTSRCEGQQAAAPERFRRTRSKDARRRGAHGGRTPRSTFGKNRSDRTAVNDKLERFLALTFLRRHVTYCVRRRRFAQAEGAAKLLRELHAADPRTTGGYRPPAAVRGRCGNFPEP